MLGRDVRTLNKLFKEVVCNPVEYNQLLFRLKEALTAKQKIAIERLRY